MKRTRILLSCLLCLVVFVLALFCLSSCGEQENTPDNGSDTVDSTGTEDNNDGCDHEWSEWAEVKASSCTESGMRERVCSKCQKSEMGEIAPLGHDWSDWETVAPATCQTEGVQSRVCSRNDTHVESKRLDKTAHVFDREVVRDTYLKTAATCTAKAVYYKSCVCGLYESGDAAGTFTYGPEPTHSVGGWVRVDNETHMGSCFCGETLVEPHRWDNGVVTKEPTHTQRGKTLYTCDDCGTTKLLEDLAPTAEHTFSEEWTQDGDVHVRACVCGKTEIKPHNWDAGTVSVLPTCGSTGVMTYVCTDHCGAVKEVSIPKTSEHHYSVYETYNSGLHKLICSVCDKTLYQEHTWEHTASEDIAPTHTSVGAKVYTCSACGERKTETVAPSEELLKEHSFADSWMPYNETQHKLTCTCGVVEYEDHAWGEWKTVAEATHTAEGMKARSCKCGETQTETIAKIEAHSFGEWLPYEGIGHARSCACGAFETQAHKAEHWDEGTVVKEATHLAKGEVRYTCTVCKATRTEELDASEEIANAHVFGAWYSTNDLRHVRECACGEIETADHAWDSGVQTAAPSCIATGVLTKTCTVCHAQKNEIIERKEHVYVNATQHNSLVHKLQCENKDCGKILYVEHNWDAGKVTEAATCLTAGVKTYTCEDCGYIRTEIIPVSTDHSWGDWRKNGESSERECTVCHEIEQSEHQWDAGTVTLPATHMTDGILTYKCLHEGCEETTESVIPRLADQHTFVKDPTNAKALMSPATCTAYAVYYLSCECGAVDKREVAETFEYADGGYAEHDFTKTDFDPKYLKAEATCTTNATYYKSCTACGAASETEWFTEPDTALGHTYSEKKTPATCDTDGKWVYTCHCGHSYEEVIPKLGHLEVTDTKLATCTEDGEIRTYCTRSGCTKAPVVEVLPAGHNFVEISRVAPTCSEDGEIVRKCSVCQADGSEILKSTGAHDYSVVLVESVQTCVTPGITKYKCECGAFKPNENGTGVYEEYLPKTEHKHFVYNKVAATCTTPGYTQSLCICGYVLSTVEDAEASGHDWKYKSGTPATCTSAGFSLWVCSVEGCGATKTEVEDKLAHNTSSATFEATCESDAYEVITCSNCDYRVVKTAQGTAKNHSYQTTTVAATCEGEGYTLKTCERCGKTEKSNVVAPLGHDWTNNDATCYTPDYCDRGCGKVGAAATGVHNYAINASKTVLADCEHKGSQTFECTTAGCTASYTVETAMVDHTLDLSTTEIKTNTTTGTDAGCITQEIKCTLCTTCNKTIEVVYDTYNSCRYNKQLTKAATCQKEGLVTYTCSVEGCGHSYTETLAKDAEAHKWVDSTQALSTGNTKTMKCAYEGCEETKTVVDASNGVTADDLDNSKELVVGGASITLDDATKEGLKESVGDGSLNLSVESIAGEDLGNLVDLPDGSTVYNLTMSNGTDQNITDFDGTVTVRIPYELEAGEDPDAILIWYIDEDGNVDEIKAKYVEVGGEGFAEFETTHFSYYTVTRLTPKQRCEKYGHTNKTVEQKANCLIDGYVIEICTHCGHKETVSETEALGHDWKETVTPATCTTAGHTVTVCLNCQLEYKKEQKALGHKLEISPADSKAATCTEAGYTRYVCKNEGCTHTHDVAIAKKGHVYGNGVTTAATCTEGGYTTYTCTNCQQSYVASLTPAKGHSITDRVVAPTCTEGGYTEHFCKTCDTYFENTDETEKTAHAWNIKAPTCSQGQICTVCGTEGLAATNAHEYGEDGFCKEESCRKECEHAWYDGEVVLPTCEEDGYTKRFCSHCHKQDDSEGFREYKKQEHEGHRWKDVDSVAPTCKEPGYNTSRCTVCDEVRKEELAPKKHETVTERVTPTCETDGYIRDYCKVCGEDIHKEILKALGHQYDVVERIEATCENKGYTKSVCANCGDTQEITEEKLVHELVLKHSTEPTCSKEGYQYFVCSHKKCNYKEEITIEKLPHVCGDWVSLNDTVHKRKCDECGHTEIVKHEWDKSEVITEASHSAAGEKLLTCTTCGETKTEVIPQIPHSFGEWAESGTGHVRSCLCGAEEYAEHTWTETEHVDATCTENGKKVYVCDDCRASKTESIPATGHSFGKWTADGDEHKRVCEICDTTEALAHSWNLTEHVDATCAKEGKDVYTCSTCQAEKNDVLPKTDKHSFGEWTETDGGRKRVCGVCGAEEFTKHDWKLTEGVEATCTADGKEVYTCSICKVTETKVIPATGHDFRNGWIPADDGMHKRVCAICDATETAEHSWNEGVETKQPTHFENGVLTKTCKDCQATQEEPIEKLPEHIFDECVKLNEKQHVYKCKCGESKTVEHDWDKSEVISPATHKAAGERRLTCTACGETKTEVIPQIPHSFGKWNADGDVHVRSCDCGATETMPHIWEESEVLTPPTHLTEGEVKLTCKECLATKAQALEKTKDHKHEESARTEPTCTAEGSVTYTCACGDSYTETLKKLDHSYTDGVCSLCGKPESGEGCDHDNLDSCEVKVEFLSNIESCNGGVRIYYICPVCVQEVKVELRITHDYVEETVDLNEKGCPCENTVLVINQCRFCGNAEATVESDCKFRVKWNDYHDPLTGVYHDVPVYTCPEHKWSYQADLAMGVEKDCARIDVVTYTFGIGSDEEFKMEFTIVYDSHNGMGESSETEITDTDENGKVWNAIQQVYKRTCRDCGAILSYEEAVIRIDENGNFVWGHMIAKQPVNPFDEECTEFIIDGEMYQIAEYEQNEEGEWICVYMEGREIGYRENGEIEGIEISIEKYDLNGETVYEAGKAYQVINGVEILREEYTCDYVAITLNNGEIRYRPSRVTESSYNETGELEKSYVETWAYETVEGNNCKLIVTYTDNNGAVKVAEEYFHGETEETVTFLNGGNNCNSGYRITETCKDCGAVTDEHNGYGHFYNCVEEYDLAELGHECGGTVFVEQCMRCDQRNVVVDMPSGFVTADKEYGDFEGKDENGFDGESESASKVYTHSCPKCGFKFTETVQTVTENCQRYSHLTYRFGIADDGSAKLELQGNRFDGFIEHKLETEELQNKTEQETDENGNILTVNTVERKSYCTACQTVISHTLTVTKTDANGNLIYQSIGNYQTGEDGNVYVSNRVIRTYGVAVLESGETFAYQLLQLTERLNVAGEVIFFERYDYIYEEGDYCHRVVKYSNSNSGDGIDFPAEIQTNHGDTERGYEFLKDNNCANGVMIKDVCTRCGEMVNSETYYHHITMGEEILLDSKCGLSIEVYFCPCGQQGGWHFVEHGCKFKVTHEPVGDKESGNISTLITYTCQECGFVYTELVRNEFSKEDCHSVTYQTIRFGIDAEGNAQYEIERTVDNGYSHKTTEEVLSESQSVETETGLLVTTREVRYVCKNCGTVESHNKTVLKTDKNENSLYRYQATYAYDGNGNVYVETETETEYVIRELPSGKPVSYLLKETNNQYDAEGNKIFYSTRTNTYKEGEFCAFTSTYTDSNGKNDTEEFVGHSEYIVERELVKGATDCKEGWIIRERCSLCGEVFYEDIRYGHERFETDVEMDQYGSKCGGYITIQGCLCGRQKEVYTHGLCCSFKEEWLGDKESDKESGEKECVLFTCTKCGFRYSFERYYEYGENCTLSEVIKYRFGIEKDGSAAYEIDNRYNRGVNHNNQRTEAKPTEETVDGLRVVTTVCTDTCSRCNKLLNVYTYVEKFDENGNMVYRGESRQDPNTKVEGGLYKAYESWTTYGYAKLESGEYRQYTVGEFNANYTVDGTVSWSDLFEYTYPKEGDYCHAIRKHINAKGDVVSEEEVELHGRHVVKYELSEKSETCKDGVDRVTYCAECETEIDRQKRWTSGHYIDRENAVDIIDLNQEYGAVCGAVAYVYSCPCGERKDLKVSAKCHFDSVESYWYDDKETGNRYHGQIYTCSVTDPETCGFRYLVLDYTASDDKCYGYKHLVYYFGFDRETGKYDGVWENSYATGKISHAFTSETKETVDAENGTRVWEEIYTCKNCGVVERKYVYTYKAFGNGNEYEAGVDRYYYNTYDINSNYLKQWDHQENLLQTQENGEWRTVILVEMYTYYNEKNEVTSWSKSEYDYSQSVCRPVRTYTNSNGSNEVYTDYTNHWWNHNIEDWENGRGPTCTQEAVRIMHCLCCEATERSYYGRHGHSYQYNSQTGIYTCGNCGLENFTGGDGAVELEDLTNRWGDGAKYIVGFYNRGNFEDYLIGLYLVVDEEEHYLEVEATVEGTLIYVDAQTVRSIAAEMGLGACEYMLRVTFVPVGVDGEYDFAITLDPHIYQKDDANCVIPEKTCEVYHITAYKCIFCEDTYKTSTWVGHQNDVVIYPIGECGSLLHVYTCKICQGQSTGMGWREDHCDFKEENLSQKVDGVWHEIIKYTCSKCGFVYLYENYSAEKDEFCNYRYFTTYSWDLQEDGTYAEHITVAYDSIGHNTSQNTVESKTEQDADGNTVLTETYLYKCIDCGAELYTRSYKRVTDANGNEILTENSHEHTNGDAYTNRNTYTYFIGDDGGYYVESEKYEHTNVYGDQHGWIRTYTYDFTSQTRYFEMVDLNGGYVQDSGSEWFELTGKKDEGEGEEPDVPVDPKPEEPKPEEPEPDTPDTPVDPEKPEDGEGTGGDDTTGDLPVEFPDFDMEEIVIAQATSTDRDWFGDPSNALSAAVYERNMEIEEKLNVMLSFVVVDSKSFHTQATNMAMSGLCEWDLISYSNAQVSRGIVTGNFANLTDEAFTYLNLDASYWNQSYLEAAFVGGLYSAVSNANLSVLDRTFVTYYNETLATNCNLASIYEAVLDGTWTVELMKEYMQMCYADLNDNGTIDAEDRIGLIGPNNGAAFGFLHAGGVGLTTVAGDSYRYDVNDRLTDMIMRVDKLWNETPGACRFNTVADTATEFAKGRALFMTNVLNPGSAQSSAIKESGFEYGILPMPKFDESQEAYTSAVLDSHSVYAVLQTQNEAKKCTVSAVMELAAQTAADALYSAYYEDVMGELPNDSEKTAVFELVTVSPFWEVIDVYANNLSNPVNTLWTSLITNNKAYSFNRNYTMNKEVVNMRLSDFLMQMDELAQSRAEVSDTENETEPGVSLPTDDNSFSDITPIT